MTTFLPLVALVLAIVAVALTPSKPELRDKVSWAKLGAALTLTALAVGGALLWKGYESSACNGAVGFGLGAAASIALGVFRARSPMGFSLALAVCAVSLIEWMPEAARVDARFGLMTGAALLSWVILDSTNRAHTLFGLFVAVVSAASFLGMAATPSAEMALVGSFLGVAAVAGLLTAEFVSERATRMGRLAAGLTLMLALVFVVAIRYLNLQDVWLLFGVGLLAALVANWLVTEDSSDLTRPLIAVILWIGLATLSFAMRKGFGMSLCLAGGVFGLVLLGNGKSLMTIGPLLGLVLFRMFREVHVDATRAIDIGQHYSLIGLLIGCCVPLIATEWRSSRRAGSFLPVAQILAVILILSIPVLVIFLMGAKGVVGLVAGSALSSFMLTVKARTSGFSLSLAAGIGAGATTLYGFFGDSNQFTREEKLAAVWPIALSMAVMLAVVALLARKEESIDAVV